MLTVPNQNVKSLITFLNNCFSPMCLNLKDLKFGTDIPSKEYQSKESNSSDFRIRPYFRQIYENCLLTDDIIQTNLQNTKNKMSFQMNLYKFQMNLYKFQMNLYKFKKMMLFPSPSL